jgi:mannose-6-phosphate isomerase
MQIVRGHLQAYDWGPVDGLAVWTAATGGPQAELWFGTHPNGPSPLRDGPGESTTPTTILTKILAAVRPLSIQIHPPAQFAGAGFAAQQADPAAARLLADPFAKAEMLIALEPFVILEGFRDPQVSAAVFADLGGPLNPIARVLGEARTDDAIRGLLGLSPEVVSDKAAGLPAAFLRAGLNDHAAGVIAEVIDCYPDDPGVFVAAMLHSRTLQPGEAVYVDPGTVHAYVRGVGIEVMTNSDNVLRLGLTSKVIAVEPALAALDTSAQPHPCVPTVEGGRSAYGHPDAPFDVLLVRDDRAHAPAGRSRTILCLEGSVGLGAISLNVGDAALLTAEDPSLDLVVAGRAVLAEQVGPAQVAG